MQGAAAVELDLQSVSALDQEAAIVATNVGKRFGLAQAVDAATLHVERGELVALLGPSGSGKTTLLRIIAGFERPDTGVVSVGGATVAGPTTWVDPDHRQIGMVFQHGALFPHLDVAGNVAFGQSRPGRAQECLHLVGLTTRAKSYPHELSGGERQRVALARALAADPQVVLLDEPFASLDAGQREVLREDVAEILRAAGTSALLVTHDQAEALSLADRVVVMRAGRIEQAGTPADVYSNPCSRWIAEFLGDADVLPGTARDGVVDCELGSFAVDGALAGPVDVVVRPETVAITAGLVDAELTTAVVVERSFYGHDQLVHLQLPSGMRIRSRVLGVAGCHPGDHVRIKLSAAVVALPADGSASAGHALPAAAGATAR